MQNDVLTVARERATAQHGRPSDSFKGGTRSIDGSSAKPGDRLFIPKPLEVWPIKFGNREVQYTVAYGLDAAGHRVARNIFPSLYQNHVYEWDKETATPTGNSVPNCGEVVDAYQSHGKVNDAMNAIAGRWQLFDFECNVVTKRFERDEFYETPRFNISFIEEPAEWAEESAEETVEEAAEEPAKKPSKGAK